VVDAIAQAIGFAGATAAAYFIVVMAVDGRKDTVQAGVEQVLPAQGAGAVAVAEGRIGIEGEAVPTIVSRGLQAVFVVELIVGVAVEVKEAGAAVAQRRIG